MKGYDLCSIGSYFLMAVSLILFPLGLMLLQSGSGYYVEWWLVSLGGADIVMSFIFDWMSLTFMAFVFFISSNVLYYSVDYMGGDSLKTRFAWLVLMFVASMMLLIVSPNLISLLLGWDGLGLVSYCLVIYYQNVRSYNAGMLTVLSNRVGDVALLLAISWMVCWGGWNYLFSVELGYSYGMLWVVFFCFMAGLTKSAQIPFSAWLPAAMAAPTPVSALVHSSTLVTAGVYLLIRFSPLVEDYWGIFGGALLFISVLTMFMAGLGANFEYDLSSIIALSTLSQLGLMMMILGLGYTELAFFHLLTHAMFKALLFLCAGAIIHSCGEWQDIRMMGGLALSMPVISGCMNVANLALCGMPFLAGFYSKDLIMEIAFKGDLNFFIFLLGLISVGLTVCYSMRLSYYTMWHSWRGMSVSVLEDGGSYMIPGIFNLTAMAVSVGSFMMWIIFPAPLVIFLPLALKLGVTIMVVLGGWAGLMLGWGEGWKSVFWVLSKNMISAFVKNSMYLLLRALGGFSYFKGSDMGWSEALGSQGVYRKIVFSGGVSQWWQDNSLKVYLFTFFVWSMIVLCVLYL
uniref:NADH-ubiquinone oxidoreductase chain 5 n=1 Tax=Cermatobius longicornis TaxID=1273176 RepID=R4IS14_9MYRI|nr:NADH dehydrogenase subunit 5 [Cermatobius longicornis]AGA84606.1 NADH dehydrogenase subunit 5 [Cermatobius longicornis]